MKAITLPLHSMPICRICLLTILALVSLTAWCQLPPTAAAQAHDDMTWYLDDVVQRTFIARNHFEYYYQPSSSDMQQQRAKGEVTYFLNTPGRYSVKKTQQTIDDIMASFDDVQEVNDWHAGNGNNVVKDYRHANNRFRFSIGRREVDEGGIYYVSITEAANHYQSLGSQPTETEKPSRTARERKQKEKDNKNKKHNEEPRVKETPTPDEDIQHSTRERKPVIINDEKDNPSTNDVNIIEDADEEETTAQQPMTYAEQRELAIAQAKQKKEEEKQQKELEKQQKKERERLAREERERERLQREQEKKQQEQEKKQQREAQRQQEQAQKQREQEEANNKLYYHDIVLWMSEKYDYVVLYDEGDGCSLQSSAVKDQEMAKLTIKNALKPYKARMAAPWTRNEQTGRVEAGYTLEKNVLVFSVGEQDGNITVNVVELTEQQFNDFKAKHNSEND